MSRAPLLLKVALAWLPFLAAWVFFIMTYTGGEVSPADALASGTVSVGTAAVLGFFVWRFTGRLAWPDGLSVRFYAVHLAAGVLFAAVWILVGGTIQIVRNGLDPVAFFQESQRVLGWQLLMGLWIYGGVAAVSYTLRTRERLRQQERIAARAEALAAEARLRALRAQLNPHFLFNALHSVSFLVQEDPEEAESAIDQLGGLLRYALDEGDSEDVLLMEEWAFTSAYLDLESIRFGPRLRVDVDIDPEAMSCSVPPFSVQPLVENAVRHGIDPRPEGGLIRVRAEVDGARLRVTVVDDGPGVDPGALAGSERHGLGDLTDRLRALYGDEAALRIESAPGRGFTATLDVPAAPRADVDVPDGAEGGVEVSLP